MALELVTGRDIELITVGVVCLAGAGGWVFVWGGKTVLPAVLFVVLAGVSFLLVWWDFRTRAE